MGRVRRVPSLAWDKYKAIINDFIDNDAGKQPFIWLRKISQLSAFGEDISNNYIPVKLNGLFQYNYIRTWPANRDSISGELEGENMVLYISVRLLKENGYTDPYGYPDINWSEDRFLIEGKVYKPDGDTKVAQANNEALLFFVILKREEPQEFNQLVNQLVYYLEVVEESKTIVEYPEGKSLKDILLQL